MSDVLAMPDDPDEIRHHIGFILPDLDEKWVQLILDSPTFKSNYDNFDFFLEQMSDLPPEAVRNRLQAFEIFPFIAEKKLPYKVLEHEADWKKEHRQYFGGLLFKAIDEGKPFFENLCQFLRRLDYKNLKPNHLKRIMKIVNDSSSEEQLLSTDFAMLDDAAKHMSIDVFPSSKDDFFVLKNFMTAFYDFRKAYQKLVEGYSTQEQKDDYEALTHSLFSNIKQKDYSYFRKSHEASDLNNMADSLRWIKKNITAPFFKFEDYEATSDIYRKFADSETKLFMDIVSEMSAKDIATYNVSWHANYAHIKRALQEYDDVTAQEVVQEWEHRYPQANGRTIPALGNYSIIPLKTRQSLEQAHLDLNICTDTYADKCILGESFLFKIINQVGKTLSVFEVDDGWGLQQHETHHGISPPKEEQQAAQAYLDAVFEMQTCPDPLYDAWSRKAKTFSHQEIYGGKLNDIDRAKYVAKILLDIPTVPKSLKTVLKRVEGWSINQIDFNGDLVAQGVANQNEEGALQGMRLRQGDAPPRQAMG